MTGPSGLDRLPVSTRNVTSGGWADSLDDKNDLKALAGAFTEAISIGWDMSQHPVTPTEGLTYFGTSDKESLAQIQNVYHLMVGAKRGFASEKYAEYYFEKKDVGARCDSSKALLYIAQNSGEHDGLIVVCPRVWEHASQLVSEIDCKKLNVQPSFPSLMTLSGILLHELM